MPPKIEGGFDPIQQKWRETMQETMVALEEIFPDVGLCLFLFDQHAGQPRANYISNAARAQTLKAIKEWVARQEPTQPTPEQ
jgi:hypothetical protein